MSEEQETNLHPLNHDWVLWEHAGGAKNPNAWKENMKQLCAFNTVEDFWRNFNFIPKPSSVFFDGESKKRVGVDNKVIEEYSLFKRGIEPEWGDPANSTGGEFFCRHQMEGEILDMYWQNLVLGVIGEVLEDDGNNASLSSYINGARVVDKGRGGFPTFRLELWISTKDLEIRNRLKHKLFDLITDNCRVPKNGHPRFEWKNHS